MHAYRLFHQAPDVVQPVQIVVKDIQHAQESISTLKPISGPMQTTVDAIGSVKTVAAQVDTISSTYLEPLRVFNTIVTGIANVRHFNQ